MLASGDLDLVTGTSKIVAQLLLDVTAYGSLLGGLGVPLAEDEVYASLLAAVRGAGAQREAARKAHEAAFARAEQERRQAGEEARKQAAAARAAWRTEANRLLEHAGSLAALPPEGSDGDAAEAAGGHGVGDRGRHGGVAQTKPAGSPARTIVKFPPSSRAPRSLC